MSSPQLWKRGLVIFALTIIIGLVFAATFVSVISPHDPNEVTLVDKFAPQVPSIHWDVIIWGAMCYPVCFMAHAFPWEPLQPLSW